MPRGYAPSRVDENQKEIVSAFRSAGATVLMLHSVGKGCPDIVCGFRGTNYLVEIKTSHKSKLTPPEAKFFEEWKGQVCIIHSAKEAIEFLGGLSGS